jgi:hypothetical protein
MLKYFNYNSKIKLTNRDYDYIFYNIGLLEKENALGVFFNSLLCEIFRSCDRVVYNKIYVKCNMINKINIDKMILEDEMFANVVKAYIEYTTTF